MECWASTPDPTGFALLIALPHSSFLFYPHSKFCSTHLHWFSKFLYMDFGESHTFFLCVFKLTFLSSLLTVDGAILG